MSPLTPIPGRISVVMPCYNAAPYVEEAVRCVMEQTWPEVELIVVDDGSSDHSEDLVQRLAEEYPGRIKLLHTSRLGPYPARNLGLRHCHGQFIAFLDADDWWLPDTLEKLHAAVAEGAADVAYCGWQNVGEGIKSEPYVPPEYEADDPVATFVRTCPWPIHAALVTREVVDRLGGFSERRFSSMDYDFWLRALALTRRIKRVPEVLAFYRWHGSGQISAVKWRQILDALAAQTDFIRANPELVRHLPAAKLRDLTEGQVLRQAYRAFWKRDLLSAQKLFRHAAVGRSYAFRDLRHILLAMLPLPLYRGIVHLSDRKRT
ncbi:MAG: glycosyltransferase [Pseudomonadota bacterium]|nr:glycosyltransferase [Pseudomonadota bacterium]MDP1904974.1 glycosyltransferase [Pseudomonadota bacterium]MDP2351107.1 glycosyltransferase [Pseudomonadota bacterium]